MSAAEAAPKKLRASEVETHKQRPNLYAAKIRRLLDVVRFRDVPFPCSIEEMAAGNFIAYSRVVQPILATTLEEFDTPNGALNPNTSHPRASTVVQHLLPAQVGELLRLRNDMQSHLQENLHALTRAPPLAGGDTARWSVGATMWLLICLLNCVLRRFGLGRDSNGNDRLLAFRPCTHAYLCAQLLVVDKAPLLQFSLRSLQMTLMNLLERLPTLAAYHSCLDEYVAALSHRCAELICGSGTRESGYNAPEWCAPVGLAHSGTRGVGAADLGPQPNAERLTCTTDFITHSMIWLATANAWIANYHQLAAPPLDTSEPSAGAERYSVRQTRQFAWFPSKPLLYRVLEFFCDYAHGCADDSYRHMLRAYVMQFEPSPSDSTVYRTYQNTNQAIPSDVIAYPLPNVSPVGREYVRLIRYNLPLVEWLHRSWNWRYGETRIRSAHLGNSRKATQLAVLYVVNLFFANRTRIPFRNRFVLYQNDPAFVFFCHRGKRGGFPFIIEQLGGWSVHVPHRVDPHTGTFPRDTRPESLAEMARSAAALAAVAVFRDAVEGNGGSGDDDDDGDYDEIDERYTEAEERGRSRATASAPRARPPGPPPRRAKEDESLFVDGEYDWKRELEAWKQADERGDDVAMNRATAAGAARIPTDLPTPEFCRVYDCETFLEAFVVWMIALLHIKGGIIDRTDLSRTICSMLGWPHPRDVGETTADADAMM